MIHSKACRDLVASFEGLKLKAYPDPATGGDPWTIGYGATGLGIHKGLVWTQRQAEQRLDADLGRFDEGVTKLIGDAQTTQNQFDALVSFSFNVGLANLKSSTLLRKHKTGDFDGAAAEFPRWDKANGIVMAGLLRRRNAEAAMYRGSA